MNARSIQLVVLSAASLCGAVAVAQDCVDWIDRNQSPRDGFELVFDSARGVVVRPGAAIWEWDGATWVHKGLSGPDAALSFHAAAYDAERGETLMHGGTTDGGFSGITNQTWAYDGSDWRSVSLDGPALATHAMTFDSTRGVVVLFGGVDPDMNDSGETWEWNAQAWTRVSTTGPSPRRAPKMAYDGSRPSRCGHHRYDGADRSSTESTSRHWDVTSSRSRRSGPSGPPCPRLGAGLGPSPSIPVKSKRMERGSGGGVTLVVGKLGGGAGRRSNGKCRLTRFFESVLGPCFENRCRDCEPI